MARKEQMLTGIDYDGSIIVGTEKNDYINKPCTVVIHEGKPERVFTESEVRAVFIALSQKPGVSWQSLLKVAKEHGIILDPA